MVIQDLLRVFIIRIACISPIKASVLLQPLILWIRDQLSDLSSLSDVDAWKVVTVYLLQVSCFNLSSYCVISSQPIFGVMNLSAQLKYLLMLWFPVFGLSSHKTIRYWEKG